jgi:hypothetical protein
MTRGSGAKTEEVSSPQPSVRTAIDELDRWKPLSQDLEPLREQVRALVLAAFSTPGSASPTLQSDDEKTSFLLERIHEGWASGVPAVRVVAPAFDEKVLLHRVRSIDGCTDPSLEPALEFRAKLKSDPARVLRWVDEILAGGEESCALAIESAGLGATYALSVLRLSLLGELGEWSGRMTAGLAESEWPRGDCPVCGSFPALAEMRGLEQRRFLRCSLCGAGWPGSRLQCAFCNCADHDRLHVLSVEEDQGRCRAVACDVCGGRLKVATTLVPLSAPGLVVAELGMMHLGFISWSETSPGGGMREPGPMPDASEKGHPTRPSARS